MQSRTLSSQDSLVSYKDEDERMDLPDFVYVRNEINRRPLYAVVTAIAIVGSFFMFLLTTYFKAEFWQIAIFSAMPFLTIFAVFLGDMISPIEIGVGSEGIRLVLKYGRRLDIRWEDVVSLQPYRAPDFYHLRFRRKDGSGGLCTLSREPANQVRHALSEIRPDWVGIT